MAHPEPAPRFIAAGQVAVLLHVSPKTVARWSNEGKLPFTRTLGGHRRYDATIIAGVADRLRFDLDGGEA